MPQFFLSLPWSAQERLGAGYRVLALLLFPAQRSRQSRAADASRHSTVTSGIAFLRSVQDSPCTETGTLAFRVQSIRTSGTARLSLMRESGIAAYALPARRRRGANRAVVAEAYVYPPVSQSPNLRRLCPAQQVLYAGQHQNPASCSRIRAATCPLMRISLHKRLCQRGYLGQGINLPFCGVRLEFEASLPVSEGCSWVSLETDP